MRTKTTPVAIPMPPFSAGPVLWSTRTNCTRKGKPVKRPRRAADTEMLSATSFFVRRDQSLLTMR